MSKKIRRVRTGCWTCKERRKKCDETKPACLNCTKGNRVCGGYGVRLAFDVDDSSYTNFKSSVNGATRYGFVGRPKPSHKLEAVVMPVTRDGDEDKSTEGRQFKMVNSFVDTIETKIKRRHSQVGEKPSATVKSPRVEDLMSEGLTTFLYSPSPLSMDETYPKVKEDPEFSNFMEAAHLYPPKTQTEVPYLDENRMLKHFFNKLLPLIDMHPNTPWPELALKYCDFEIAKSCFLSLSCMHLVANENDHRGKAELFMKSVNHIDKIMNHLIEFVQDNNLSDIFNDVQKAAELEPQVDIKGMVNKLKEEKEDGDGTRKQSRVFVVLLLIFVQLLYGILENGRSALSRIFFKLFASMTQNPDCKATLDTIDQSQALICVLSWWDTIAAITSPDCRLPYCLQSWYGLKGDVISTEKMSGCPGELFVSLSKICFIRNGITYNKLTRYETIKQYDEVRTSLLNYREYVTFDPAGGEVDDFSAKTYEDFFYIRLSCVQCWSLAAQIKLETTVRPTDATEEIVLRLILEFIGVYRYLDPRSHPVGQIVWPLLEVGSHCKRESERSQIRKYVNNLYYHTRGMNLLTISQILEEVWRDGVSLDSYLSQKEWLQAGIELLAL